MCAHQQQGCKLPFGCVGSRFIGFEGAEPPLLVADETFGAFRQCTFEDFDLSVEVFDVSFGGLLHLEDCTFRNVELRQGKLVGTSLNDDFKCNNEWLGDFMYMPADDAAYDIPLEPLDPGNPAAGMHVGNATLSDCLRHAYRCVSIHGSMHVCARGNWSCSFARTSIESRRTRGAFPLQRSADSGFATDSDQTTKAPPALAGGILGVHVAHHCLGTPRCMLYCDDFFDGLPADVPVLHAGACLSVSCMVTMIMMTCWREISGRHQGALRNQQRSEINSHTADVLILIQTSMITYSGLITLGLRFL